MSNLKSFKPWQLIFAAVLITGVVLASQVFGNIRIDTNLSDLSPGNTHTASTRQAISALSQNIQSRILLLITGDDEDAVIEANEQLRSELSRLTNSAEFIELADSLSLVDDPETIAENLIEQLRPFRFSLLNAKQRQQLEHSSSEELVDAAKRSLYGMNSAPQLYSFIDDPFSIHSEFILNLFEENQVEESSAESFQALISLVADQSEMNLEQQELILEQLNNAITLVRADHSVEIDRSGVFFFAIDAASNSKKDISFISTGSSIGVVLLLLLAFRSIRSFVLPLVSIGLGVTFAFLFLHALYGKVHVLTIVFGASLIGIVVDYSLHYFYHKASVDNSVENQHKTLHQALLLSLLTSLIGYSALGFSGLEALRKVALFSCCGLFVAWLSVISIGDLLTRRSFSLDQIFLPKLQSLISSAVGIVNPRLWLISSIAIIGFASYQAQSQALFNDDPRLFYKASEQLLASEKRVAAASNDYEPGRYIVVQGSDPQQVYARSERLFEIFDNHPELSSNNLVSILKWVPSQLQQQSDYQRLAKLYGLEGAADKLLNDLADNTGSQSLKDSYLAAQGIILRPSDLTRFLGQSIPPMWYQRGWYGQEVLEQDQFNKKNQITSFVLLRKGINTSALDSLDFERGVSYVNTLGDTTRALKEQRIAASKLLILAYTLVGLLLIARYRRIASLTMLLVPISASALVIIICASLGVTLNLFHMMALFLVLGFGMDYTIFIEEFGERTTITLQAILLSAMTSLLSFGLLALSNIPVAQSFGSTLLIGNCFNLVGVFVYSLAIKERS